MKNNLVLLFFLIMTGFTLTAQCSEAYSAATYALSHTKKSLKANNFDHQQFYAEKAYESFEKIKNLIDDCNCSKAVDPVLDGLENLDSALEPRNWDVGRHYAKKAFANAADLIFELDSCSESAKKLDSEKEETMTPSTSQNN